MKLTFLAIASFGVLSFSATAQTTVFSEDFQGGLPSSWVRVINDSNTPAMAVEEFDSVAWLPKMDPDDSNNVVMASTSYFTPAGTANRWLISPVITLGAYGNAMSFDAKSHDPSFPDDYLVLVSTTGASLTDFTDTLIHVQAEYETFQNRTIDLSAKGLDGQNILLAFVITTDDGFKLYVDNLEVSKDDPAGLSSPDKFDLSWSTLENGLFFLNSDAVIESTNIFNLAGQKVGSASTKTVDLRTFESGLYLLNIQTDRGMKTIKVQKF